MGRWGPTDPTERVLRAVIIAQFHPDPDVRDLGVTGVLARRHKIDDGDDSDSDNGVHTMTADQPRETEHRDVDQSSTVHRTDHGVSITTEVKRGTGTRDQDKHVIKAKGATFDEAQHFHRQALAYLDGADQGTETPVLDRVRRWDPQDQDVGPPGADDE